MLTGEAAAGGGGGAASEKDTQVGPEVGPTSAFYSHIPTGMRGPTCIVWADLTPLLAAVLHGLGQERRRSARGLRVHPADPGPLARGRAAIKCPSPLNVLKDRYDRRCY